MALSLNAGHPIVIKDHQESFVSGMNGKWVLKPIWNLTKNLIKRSVVVSHADICANMRMLLTQNKILVESASAATVAAALSNDVPDGKIVCVISGGNEDLDLLKTVLDNRIPSM